MEEGGSAVPGRAHAGSRRAGRARGGRTRAGVVPRWPPRWGCAGSRLAAPRPFRGRALPRYAGTRRAGVCSSSGRQ